MMKKLLGSLKIITIIVVTAIFSLNLLSLSYYPAPFGDEAIYASRAWGLWQTGKPFGTLDYKFMTEYDGHWTLNSLALSYINASIFLITQKPSFLGGRIISLFFGFLLLGSIYQIVVKALGNRQAFLSIFLVGLSPPFFYSAHLGRPDIFVASLGFWAIAIALRRIQDTQTWVGDFAAGLLVCLAFEIHPNGILYFFPIVGIYIWYLKWNIFRVRKMWSFLSGLILGCAIYGLIHIFPFPNTYFTLADLLYSDAHIPPILSGSLTTLWISFSEMGQKLRDIYLFVWPIFIWVIFSITIIHREKTELFFVYLTFIVLFFFALLIGYKSTYYDIQFSPLFNILLAAYFVRIFTETKSWVGRLERVIVTSLYASVLILFSYYVMLKSENFVAFQRASVALETVIKQDDVIMGASTFWFGLYSHEFIPWEELVYPKISEMMPSIGDGLLDKSSPDILIIDGFTRKFIVSDKVPLSERPRFFYLLDKDLNEYLSINAKLVMNEDFGGETGLVEVYRFQHDK